jgi:hypothetical protein
MDVQPFALLDRKGQGGEEGALLGVELASRPADRGTGADVHAGVAAEHGVVVVAANGEGAAFDFDSDRVENPGGVGAVADAIAKKNKALGAGGPGMLEAGLERFAVSVDVGQKCKSISRRLSTMVQGLQ